MKGVCSIYHCFNMLTSRLIVNLQLVRYQRHVVQLWEEGLIYGFMGRNDIDAVLSGHPPGSFIIRFSERHAGQFAVSYVVSRGDIRHYLIKSNDTAGAKITLPDFLRSVHPWRYLLRFSLTDQVSIGVVACDVGELNSLFLRVFLNLNVLTRMKHSRAFTPSGENQTPRATKRWSHFKSVAIRFLLAPLCSVSMAYLYWNVFLERTVILCFT